MDKPINVITNARKLIFRVPEGPKVSFPAGAEISSYGQNNNDPVIVVQNMTDGGSWQGADAEQGIIIINEIPDDAAEVLLDLYDGTIKVLHQVVALAAEWGYNDQYTTRTSWVDKHLSPAGRMDGEYTGIVKRDERDLCPVWQTEDGIFMIINGGSETGHRIESDILARTYRMPDGSQIDLEAIPVLTEEDVSVA